MFNKSVKLLIVILTFFIGISSHLIYSKPTIFEKFHLRTNNKIAFAGFYGVADTYNVILKKQIGEVMQQQAIEQIAVEFTRKHGGQIFYINQYGPNFGIKNISSDSAYQISADERVLQVQQSLNKNAPPKFY